MNRGQNFYYREARDRIVAFHRARRDSRWLFSEAMNIEGIASLSLGRTRTRLRHNARAIKNYGEKYGNRNFDVLHELKLYINYGDVRITAIPDLHIREGNDEKIIKLDFSINVLPDDVPKIMCQVLLDASTRSGLPLPSKNILLFDVSRGKEYRAARVGSRMQRNIEATCETISNIWDTI